MDQNLLFNTNEVQHESWKDALVYSLEQFLIEIYQVESVNGVFHNMLFLLISITQLGCMVCKDWEDHGKDSCLGGAIVNCEA